MSENEVDDRIIGVFEAYSHQDAAGAAAEFADDGTFHEVPREMVFSKPEYRTYLADAVFEAFPDYTVERWTAFTTYHWGTLIEWTFSGTHEGNAGDTKLTKRKITLPLVSIVTMSDEGITTWMDFFDSDRLDEQLRRI